MADDIDRTNTAAAQADADTSMIPVLNLVPGGIADPDVLLRELPAPVLVRVQFSLYDKATESYRSWPYVRFGLSFPSAELAGQFRDDMDAFIRGWVVDAAARVGGKA